MLKLSVFLPFLLLFFTPVSSNSLCSTRKAPNSCICKLVTSESSNSITTVADCASINLDVVPNQDDLTPDLNLLDLSYNDIERLDSTRKLSSQTLETLLLSYNRITTIDDGFFDSMPKIRKLVLSHNSLTSLDSENLFQNCKELVFLDVSFNHIKTIHPNTLQPLTQLRELDLSYNDEGLGKALTQSNNFLSMSSNVSSLKLDNLGLRDPQKLYFANLTNLRHLSLAYNHFEEVPGIPYTVEFLDLSGSDIKELQGKYLTYHSLKTLKLERMRKLEQIHHYAFFNLQALEELSIRFCPKLKEFNELVFGVLNKKLDFNLKRLSLSGNGIRSLNSTYKYLIQIADFVDLTDNPWDCDCDLLWLQEMGNLYKEDNIRCSSPSSLTSKKLMDITERNVPSCYPQKYGKRSHRILISFLVFLVILLSGLVGYLIYYSPDWYGALSRRVGPNSPYSPERAD